MLKKYDSYLDSGVEWLGEIPEHWELKKLKYAAAVNPSKSGILAGVDEELHVTFLPMEKVSESGIVETDIKKPIKELINGFTFFQENDVIVAKITPCFENGKGAYLENLDSPFGFGSTEFHVLRGYSQVLLNEYLYFVTKSNLFMELGEGSMAGAGGQKRVPTSFLQDYLIAFPKSLHEQKIIVDFIKAKTSQIDTLIQKKQQMIVLLEEEKIAVINEAVTKGLNLAAPMKDSGIEWLGDVPAHWEVKKLKHVVSKVGSGVTPKGGAEVYQTSGVPFFRSQNIYFDGFRLDDIAYISEEIDEDMKNTRVEIGDVLLNITGASIGRCYYADSSFGGGNVNQHVCIIRPVPNLVSTPFLYYLIRSEVGQLQIDLQQTGANREGLNFEQLKNFILPVPSVDEQKQIVQELQQEIKNRNNTILRVRNEIQLMQEYRTALISETVTGKIDVRDYQPEPITSTALA